MKTPKILYISTTTFISTDEIVVRVADYFKLTVEMICYDVTEDNQYYAIYFKDHFPLNYYEILVNHGSIVIQHNQEQIYLHLKPKIPFDAEIISRYHHNLITGDKYYRHIDDTNKFIYKYNNDLLCYEVTDENPFN